MKKYKTLFKETMKEKFPDMDDNQLEIEYNITMRQLRIGILIICTGILWLWIFLM